MWLCSRQEQDSQLFCLKIVSLSSVFLTLKFSEATANCVFLVDDQGAEGRIALFEMVF